MTAPFRQRVRLAVGDERASVRRSAARHDRAVAAAGVLPPEPRHAGRGLISLTRLAAHDHDDVTMVCLRGELDLSGTAVLHAQFRNIRWQARAVAVRPVLPVTGLLLWFEAHDSAGHAVTGTGLPRSAAFPRGPRPAPDHHSRRHAHGHIPGAHQRAAIFPPCPASGQRRSVLARGQVLSCQPGSS
jgi:hypothetical protein